MVSRIKQGDRIKHDTDADYSHHLVNELSVVMKMFLNNNLTTDEAQSATQAYATIRSAEIAVDTERRERAEDRRTQFELVHLNKTYRQ